MSRVSVKINNPKSIDNILLRELSQSRLPRLERKIAKNLQPKIEKEIIKAFHRTNFYKGLRGDFLGNEELDVRAHAGLTDEMANYAITKLEETWSNSVKLQRRSDKLGLALIITTINFAKLEKDLTYDSNGNQINWLSWFIHGDSGDVEAFITFDALATVYGRSEEAIMIETPGRFLYDISNYELGRPPSFIFDTLENKQFVKKITEMIINEYRKELDNL